MKLVDGADAVTAPPSQQLYSRRWLRSWDGSLIVFVATVADRDSRRHDRLTWTPSNGSFIHTLDDESFGDVQYGSYWSNPTQPGWLGYTTKRDTGFNLAWVDVATGKRQALMSNLGVMDNWQLVVAPDRRTAAVRIGPDLNSLSSQADLYLASLEGQRLMKLAALVGMPYWSPDSAVLAFIRRDNRMGTAAIHVASSDGTLLQQLPLRQPLNGFVLRGWTHCD